MSGDFEHLISAFAKSGNMGKNESLHRLALGVYDS